MQGQFGSPMAVLVNYERLGECDRPSFFMPETSHTGVRQSLGYRGNRTGTSSASAPVRLLLTCAFVTPKREITLGRNRKAEVVICEYEDCGVEFTAKGPSIASPPQTFDDTVAKYIAGGCVEMPAEAGRDIQVGDMQP